MGEAISTRQALMQMVDKVAAFVTRQTPHGIELLLLAHPFAGIQLPAGTVEENEDPREAVVREVAEEAGIEARIEKYLGTVDEALPENVLLMARKSKIYARPDAASFDWAELRRGIGVRRERAQGDWTQITFTETDRYPNPNFVTYQITGWVPNAALASSARRYLFQLATDDARESWTQFSDNHTFRLFWARLDALPEIAAPQKPWLERIRLQIDQFSRDP